MAWFSELLLLLVAISASFLPVFGETIDFRWCTKGEDEQAKCEKFKAALTAGLAASAGVDIKPDCVDGKDEVGCMKKIKNGTADLITLDGGDIYTAGKIYGMVPVVAETYGGDMGTTYYAVAVVKVNNTGVNLGNLKGKKSCHTGYQRTTGYNVPVGYLLESKKMERVGCGANGTAASVSKFFKQSCIAGVPSAFTNLCALCRPEGNCQKSVSNKFYGYNGAFKCMAEGVGDVAFVKHLTTGEVVQQGGYGKMADYEYLCLDNTRKVVTVDSHEKCNLARVPSHAVMTRAGSKITVFRKALLKASDLCQGNSSAAKCSNFTIFESGAKRNLLFKDSTKKLVDVGNKNTYKLWLGDEYYKSVDGLTDPCGMTTTPPPPKASAVVLGPGSTLVLLAIGALVMRFV